MKKLLLTAAALAVLAACDHNEDDSRPLEGMTFEAASLGADGFIWGKERAALLTESDDEADTFGEGSRFYYGSLYTEGAADLQTFYTDYAGLYGSGWDTWNGFAVSNKTDMQTEGYLNEYSVYAPSGAEGSANFAIAYHGRWTPGEYGIPTIRFNRPVMLHSAAVAMTTYVYLYFKGSMPAEVVDYMVVFTGYDGTMRTGEVRVKLADSTSRRVSEGWQQVDLSALGTVTSLTVTTETPDDMCPNYVAIDNLFYYLL